MARVPGRASRRAFAVAAILALGACASGPAMGPAAADLNGVWDVSLQFSPTDPPSRTEMMLAVDDAGRLSGSFYGSPFQKADLSVRGGVLAWGAITSDAATVYNHSGRLVGGRMEGQTHAPGRDFLMIWTATRREAPK